MTDQELKEQLETETQDESNEDERRKSNGQDEDEQTPVKRMKLDDNNDHENREGPSSPIQQNGISVDKLEALRQMYEAKFIHIPSRLKGYSYAKVTFI